MPPDGAAGWETVSWKTFRVGPRLRSMPPYEDAKAQFPPTSLLRFGIWFGSLRYSAAAADPFLDPISC
jgi:hypothetical protein